MNRSRLAVSAAFALNGAMLGSWASRIPAVMEQHALSERQLGLMLLAIGLGAIVSFPVAGRAADRFGAWRLTAGLALVFPLQLVAVALAPTMATLAAALFLFGMCQGAMDVTMNSWASAVEKRNGRSIMASFHAMWSFGAGLAAALGSFAAGFTVPVHFAAAALIFGALGAALIFRGREPAVRMVASESQWRFDAALLPIAIVALISGLGEGAAADWSAVFLRDVVQAAEGHAALGFAAFSMAMVGVRLTADLAITRWGAPTVARVSAIAGLLGTAFLMSGTLPFALVGFALLGIGYASLIPIAFSKAAAHPTIPPGQAIANVAMFAYGAMLLGPPLIGLVAEELSLRTAFGLIGSLSLFILIASRSLR